MKRPLNYLLLFLLLFSNSSLARVFKFKDEVGGSYLRGSYGLSQLAKAPFDKSLNMNTRFSDSYVSHIGGELGFLFLATEYVNVKLGFEVIQAATAKMNVTDAAGVQLGLLSSRILMASPTASLGFNFYRSDQSRASIYVGVGLSDVTLDNIFDFNTTGLTEFSISDDYTEKTKASVLSYYTGAVYEFLLLDTVTLVTDLGYRLLNVPGLTYKNDITSALGAQAKGAKVRNYDGSDRHFDLSGIYAGVSLRFYIQVL